MRVMVFGDSITQGFWAIDHCWVDLIRKHYTQAQFANDNYHEIFNLGVDGDNSSDVLHRIKAEIQARCRPDDMVKPIVLIQVGTNDSSTGSGKLNVGVEAQAYRQNLKKIISTMKDIAQSVIFVGSSSCDETRTTPVSWGEYYYTNGRIKQYEDAASEVAKSEEVGFIPILDEFKRHVDAGVDLLPDGLHPNDAGHQLIADLVRPRLEEILK